MGMLCSPSAPAWLLLILVQNYAQILIQELICTLHYKLRLSNSHGGPGGNLFYVTDFGYINLPVHVP